MAMVEVEAMSAMDMGDRAEGGKDAVARAALVREATAVCEDKAHRRVGGSMRWVFLGKGHVAELVMVLAIGRCGEAWRARVEGGDDCVGVVRGSTRATRVMLSP